MAERKQYLLKVTAGPTYDTASHQVVHVNTPRSVKISSDLVDASISVRIQDYRGLPRSSPPTSPYFAHRRHAGDRYSIAFGFAPKAAVGGDELVFGNDFDRPVRDRLPPGFDYVLKTVRWLIDPGLDGDVRADRPHLYGPLLSSINVLRIGERGGAVEEQVERGGEAVGEGAQRVRVFEEGAQGDGARARSEARVPDAAAARQKWFLKEEHRRAFEFERGRVYLCDFFNPYLDFNDFALRISGFLGVPPITIPILKYWDGQPLRYVLKNRRTNTPLFVVVFALIPIAQAEDGGAEAEDEEGGQDVASKTGEAGGAERAGPAARDDELD